MEVSTSDYSKSCQQLCFSLMDMSTSDNTSCKSGFSFYHETIKLELKIV